ncbi:MAG: metallophosphoesterase [Nitrospiraceae bacterium]|nr:metallophosphoesterase [Nitrospiraceae bacterium]
MSSEGTIEFLGAVGGETAYRPEDVQRLRALPQAALTHGEQFTGRPATLLYAGRQDIVKLRAEVRLDQLNARRWAMQTLERERKLQVHHPGKTWFLIHHANQDSPTIGSICPLLTPLHTLMRPKECQRDGAERRIGYLLELFRLYFRVFRDHQSRLDEGLSNFGLDEHQRLYYLDDDVYEADDLSGFVQMLGVYFRSLEWLSAEWAAQFGMQLRQVFLEYFEDPHRLYFIGSLLGDLCIPAPPRQAALEAFKQTMVDQRRARRQAVLLPDKEIIAVMADVHANLPALDAVIGFLQQRGVDKGIVLGDVVGYGPHPNECIARLQKSAYTVLKGNHDLAAAVGRAGEGFSRYARWAMEWTIPKLSEESRHWLEELPPVLQGEGWLAVHGSPLDPSYLNAYVYEMTFEDNLNLLERRQLHVCFHGHTHVPGVYARIPKSRDRHVVETEQTLGAYAHCLVCPGSVGQPRQGQQGAQVALYEVAGKTLSFHQIAYDVQQTVQDMRANDFPETLISRLLTGY